MKKINGLNAQQVQQRIAEGKVNTAIKPKVKSNFQIIIGHVFNLFNAYNFVIAVALIAVKAYSSLFFVVVVVSNTFIRARQEIRSKNMVAKLNLIVSPKTKAIRDSQEIMLDNEELVLDDIVRFETGNQISADSIIIEDCVEVDESLLTGEADPIYKQPGDHLLSGSFILSGACYCQVEHVGKDNYANKITDQARTRKPVDSVLLNTFNKVTRYTSYLVLPLSILMLYQAYVIRNQDITSTIVNTATALLGMLPKGLVLLTSVSLAASVVKLGKSNTLVQEMFSIETLSRIDVLCLDKTGTLTEGKMEIEQVIELDNPLKLDFHQVMSSFVAGSLDNNVTFKTLKKYFTGECKYQTLDRIAFSSARKWSAATLEEIGTVIVGAPEIIKPTLQLDAEIVKMQESGARILLVGHHPDLSTIADTLNETIPLGLIVIRDPIRKDAHSALKFFSDNEVTVKVISGDNPATVSAIAMQAGVANAQNYIDASTLTTDEELEDAILNYNVIGRASPFQKHQMILTLQKHQLKVAMTGDGVNDVLALKDADVSIAMGNGSDIARQISQFVIIDGKLDTLVEVVREGRLVINNVTRSASMYYLKTIYTILLSILSILLNIPYPFIPFQMTLLDMFIEGFPSFMILFERNIEKPKESIGNHAMRFSLPNALVIVLSVATIRLLDSVLNISLPETFTILYFTTAFISIHMIYRIYKPLNWYRGVVLVIDIIGFILSTPIFWPLLEMHPLNTKLIIIILITIIICIPILVLITKKVGRYLDQKNEDEKVRN
ncbi:HAD-IC family P-type ATPase [uncultured Thomasclavelia sp.]|uniref:HAD-IC family P-type ATPase n=1 Tax=uncultured Thomasclavelia sp. TaxID=3025759 RepID=UPI0025E86474|nr:HAD-IC family P-type ATPase [uncultured Thomasclavelia sp.]